MKKQDVRITLRKSERYYTQYPDECCLLEQGVVDIFMVPWFNAEQTVDKETGRQVNIYRMDHSVPLTVMPDYQIPSLIKVDHSKVELHDGDVIKMKGNAKQNVLDENFIFRVVLVESGTK